MVSTSTGGSEAASASKIFNVTVVSCALKYEKFNYKTSGLHCNWTWDSLMCWPPTPAGEAATQYCPSIHGFDASKIVERECSLLGQWEPRPGQHNQTNNGQGWTNYLKCFTPEIYDLYKKLHESGNAETILAIANRTRNLEITGFSISLLALLISLIIFCNFRSLRNNRTRIHKNLFVAMFIQVIIRLTLYVDQVIIRDGKGADELHGIDNTKYLCEASYVLLEYARTAMFMWMFIEGLYLHNVVTLTVFQERFPHRLYTILGWVAPVFLTIIWSSTTAYYKYGQQLTCWWGYSFTPYYWILEGPRLGVIVLNFCFLLNIIRVLVVKLRQTQSSELEQVRKAVRAAIVLLPLLGITNLLNMAEAPLQGSVWEFAVWSYTTHFLTSFQGFVIALLYCFLNGEVRTVLSQNLHVYMSLRGYNDWAPRRQSMFSAAYVTAPENEHHNQSQHFGARIPIPIGSHQEVHSRASSSSSENRTCKWLTSMCFRSPKEVNRVIRSPLVNSYNLRQHGTTNVPITEPAPGSTNAIRISTPVHPVTSHPTHQCHCHHHHIHNHHHHHHTTPTPVMLAAMTRATTSRANALPPETCV